MKIGVYLETGYYKEGETLFCEDIYTILLNNLSREDTFSFFFLRRQLGLK